jgi:hypothetical protein
MRRAERNRLMKSARIVDDRWEFYRDPEGRWRWQKLDDDGSVTRLSSYSYGHLLECVSNAREQGYTTHQRFAVR